MNPTNGMTSLLLAATLVAPACGEQPKTAGKVIAPATAPGALGSASPAAAGTGSAATVGASATTTGAPATAPAARPAKAGWKKPDDDSSEGVFDPANPPPGFMNCHRNHCHRVGGGVASYQQVMDETGATKVKGQVTPDQMPPAPPDVAAPPANAAKTASGLASLVLTKGDGARHPTATNRVRVHYTGWTTDGKAFDSSVARGRPAEFPLNRVIAGWTEGLQLMVEGEERRLWIPEGQAYGGRPGRPQGMLVFDVELLQILD